MTQELTDEQKAMTLAQARAMIETGLAGLSTSCQALEKAQHGSQRWYKLSGLFLKLQWIGMAQLAAAAILLMMGSGNAAHGAFMGAVSCINIGLVTCELSRWRFRVWMRRRERASALVDIAVKLITSFPPQTLTQEQFDRANGFFNLLTCSDKSCEVHGEKK